MMKKFKDCEFYLQHGEIAHSLNIPSKYWSIQHTWLKIKKGELHRVEALNKTVRFLEIAFGNFKESDIERVQDDFSRV
jgi:hypothetical protein